MYVVGHWGKKKFRYVGINIICILKVLKPALRHNFQPESDNMERFSCICDCERNGEEPSYPVRISKGRIGAPGTASSDLSQENLMSLTKSAHVGTWESLPKEVT